MALTNTQYASIMRIFNDRQLANHREEERRLQEIREQIPAIRELDDALASLAIRKAFTVLNDDHADIDLEKAISDRREQRRQLLLSHGYPENYLDPICHCSKCSDTGYIDNRKCSCFLEMETGILYRSSNLHKLASDEDFAHFSLDWYSRSQMNKSSGMSAYEEAERALLVSRSFVRNFSERLDTGEPENLFFFGSVGTGKTFLSHAIAKELLQQGRSVLYLSAFELFDILGKYTFRTEQDMKQAHDLIFESDLLIIDDLGTELTNAFVASQLFLIINERILAGKSTIISTNLSLDRFQEIFSERTFSRIMGAYTFIHFSGEDIRLRKKLQGGH
ncbi:MAG: ATP-binding protein [Eubacteriales bacterium]|nr:ATP-binding protein [Eubacteriales bacterium]